MISKQAIKDFLERPRDEFNWVKEASREDILEVLDELPTCPNLKTELYLHQLTSFYLCACHNGFMLFLDMGLGKSLIALALIDYRKRLDRIKRALVIVPNVVNIQGWQEEVSIHSDLKMVALYGTKEQREAALEEEADLYVINYDGLQVLLTELQESKKRKKKGKSERVIDEKRVRRFIQRFQMVVYDEVHKCFAPNTLINTTKGKKPINAVNVGDEVQNLIDVGKVKQVFVNRVNLSNVVKIKLSDGNSVYCTHDHEFLTDRGWIKAIELNDMVVYSPISSVLFNTTLETGGYNEKNGFETLRTLQKIIYTKIRATKEEVLQCELCNALEEQPSRVQGIKQTIRKETSSSTQISARKRSGISSQFFSKNLRQDDPQQPHASTRNSRKGFSNKRCQWNIKGVDWKEGWKRSINRAAKIVGYCVELANRSEYKNRTRTPRRFWLSNLLQGRYRKRKTKVGDRSGRGESQYDFLTAKRSEERGEIKRVRVESVEVYQQGYNDGHFEGIIGDRERGWGFTEFYDLEIDSHPSYFANNILVHNCRNNESLTFRLCDRISKACKYRVGLTGTPVGRDATAFWAQFYLVDRGETLGTTKGLYLQSFFQVKPGYFGGSTYKLTPEKEVLLHKTLLHRSIRYADTECQDLPPLVKNKVHTNMSPDAREYYKMLLEESMEEAQTEDRETLKNYYAKWRQISSGFVYTEDDESEERLPLTFSDNQKLLALEDIVDDMPSTSKIVIFHIYNQSGAMISGLLKKMKVNHVMMNAWEKDKRGAYTRFKQDPTVTALVVNIASGGEGLNLQNANYLVFYEPTDQPIKYRQAYKRVHRGGQSQRVYMYEFITKNSIEERILGFLEEGKSLFDAVVDGKIGMKRLSGMYGE